MRRKLIEVALPFQCEPDFGVASNSYVRLGWGEVPR